MDPQQALEQIRQLLDCARENGVPATHVFAAGGCARDLHHGVAPHDIDIVVIDGEQYADRIFTALEDLGYECTDDNGTDDPSGGPDAASRWLRVTQYSRQDSLDVDVLFAHPRYSGIEDVLSDFDFNINQAIIGHVNGAIIGPLYMNTDGSTALRKLRDAQVSDERQRHIEQVALNLGWVVIDDSVAKKQEGL